VRGRQLFVLAEALVFLCVGRAAVLLLPFSRVTRGLGLARDDSVRPLEGVESTYVRPLAWAVNVLADRAPWQGTCLTRAVAVCAMLRCRGLPATLYLGVARDGARPRGIAAHAWVISDGRILSGAAERKEFVPVASFSRE
jgi:hypothetical protein